MTKNKLVEKVLSGAKNFVIDNAKDFVIGAGIAGLLYGNVKAQDVYKVPIFGKAIVEGKEVELGGPNLFDTKYISEPKDNAEIGVALLPYICGADTTDIVSWELRGGYIKDLKSKVEYQAKKMQENKMLLKLKNESVLGVPLHKPVITGGIDKLGDEFKMEMGKITENLKKIQFNNEADIFYVVYRGHAINKDGKPETDKDVLDGKKTPFVLVRPANDPITSDSKGNLYLIGDIYEMIASGESKVDGNILIKDSISGTTKNLIYDSLYLEKNKEAILQSIQTGGNPGHVKEFFKIEDEKQKPKDEKSPSNLNGRLKAGAGVTAPLGYALELNPQLQLDKNGKVFAGIYASYQNASKSLENVTTEPGFRQVINVPAGMYIVNTGIETKETQKVQNGFGLGVNLSYVAQDNLEFFIKAGLLPQKSTKTKTAKGKEYMEVQGVETDAQSFDETNSETIKESLLKSAQYAGAGAEYFPFSQKSNALKNVSVYGEAGYIFGRTAFNGMPLLTAGAKYNLRKTQNKSKQ